MKVTHHLVYAFCSMSIWFSDSALFLSVFRLFSLCVYLRGPKWNLSAFKGIELHVQTLKWNMFSVCRCVYTAEDWLRFCGDSVSRSVEKNTRLFPFSLNTSTSNRKVDQTLKTHQHSTNPVCLRSKPSGWTLTLPTVLLNDSHPLMDCSNPTILQFLLSRHPEIQIQCTNSAALSYAKLCYDGRVLLCQCEGVQISN